MMRLSDRASRDDRHTNGHPTNIRCRAERTLRRILIKSRFHHELAGLQVASKLFTFAAAPQLCNRRGSAGPARSETP